MAKDDDAVGLRAYFERLLKEHQLRHVTEQIMVTTATKELDRRLDALNHNQERALTDREQFARIELVDVNSERLRILESEVKVHFQLGMHPGAEREISDQETRLRSLESWRNESSGVKDNRLETRTLVFALLGALIGVGGLLVVFLR